MDNCESKDTLTGCGNYYNSEGIPWSPAGHCSKYEKAVEYCYAVIQGRDDEDRVYLHKDLAALYGLDPSETRHITDNLPIPMDPYAETFDETLAKCASTITNEFQKLKDMKDGGRYV